MELVSSNEISALENGDHKQNENPDQKQTNPSSTKIRSNRNVPKFSSFNIR
jgi:hypothetical protein